jgi:hypothetical protein
MFYSVSSIVASAFCRGGSFGLVRASVRSRSGWVCVLRFRSAVLARCFASVWAVRLGHSVFVRRALVGSGFLVSVPCAFSSAFVRLSLPLRCLPSPFWFGSFHLRSAAVCGFSGLSLPLSLASLVRVASRALAS